MTDKPSEIKQHTKLKLKRMMKIIREKKQTKSDFPVRNGERVMKIRAAEVVPVLADLLLPACLLRDSSVTDDERLQLAMLRDVVLAAASSGVFSPIAVKNRIHTILGKDRYNAMVAGNTAQITAIRKAVSELRKASESMKRECCVCKTLCARLCTYGKLAYCGRECQVSDWKRHKAAEHSV